MNKLHSSRGETLIESLCAILLVALVMLFLSTAIATAARVNLQIRNTDITFHTENAESKEEITVLVLENGTEKPEYSGKATLYTTETANYRYYRYSPKQEVTAP